MSDEPRIPPLPPDEWEGEIKRILDTVPAGIEGRLGDNNIFPTFARHPDLFLAWLRFGGYLLTSGKLSGPDRELLILRTAVNCRSDYEWGQHVRISLAGGIDRETIDRVLEGRTPKRMVGARADSPSCRGRAPCGVAHVRRTWEALAETYDTER